MPQNDVKGQMVAGPLRNTSIQYRNPLSAYVNEAVFPVIDVDDPKVKLLKYKRGAFYRNEATKAAPGTRAPRGGFVTEEVPMNTEEYWFASEVTRQDRRFAKSRNAPPLQPDIDAVEFATDKILLNKEVRAATLVKTTNWCGVGVGGEDAEGLWAAGAGNTFLADIVKGKAAIREQSGGFEANTLIIDQGTLDSLATESTVLALFSQTQTGILTAGVLAQLLKIKQVLVAGAVESTAKEAKNGNDFTGRLVWETNKGKGFAFLCHVPERMGLKIQAMGCQARLAYEDGLPRSVRTWYEPAERQDVYEVAEETDIIVVDSALGYHWKDTLKT